MEVPLLWIGLKSKSTLELPEAERDKAVLRVAS